MEAGRKITCDLGKRAKPFNYPRTEKRLEVIGQLGVVIEMYKNSKKLSRENLGI